MTADRKCIDMQLMELRTFQQAQKALNHGAKRSLSNTFYLANEALETPSKMQEYLLQICADSKSGLVAVNAIEIQRQIAFKTYKLCAKPFEVVSELCHELLGLDCNTVLLKCRGRVPKRLASDVRLIGHVMSNAIDNAKMHGLANGKICLYLDYNGTHFMLTLVNQPGENHQAALDRQAALGKGFMFSDLPQEVNLPGRTHSTFLGVGEMKEAAGLLCAEINCIFMADEVQFTFNVPAQQLTENELQYWEAQDKGRAVAALLPLDDVVLVQADDDVAPRLQAKGILKAVNAHADSLILGATFAEANTLVQTVLNLMQVHSQQKIIVILDQVSACEMHVQPELSHGPADCHFEHTEHDKLPRRGCIWYRFGQRASSLELQWLAVHPLCKH